MTDLPANSKLADCIVVVSGLPRSGTSMMMGMLEAGGIPILQDGVRKPDRDNPRGYFEYQRAKRLREGDADWLEAARGKAVKLISELLFYLPNQHTYRVVFMQRDIGEILASQSEMLKRLGKHPGSHEDKQLAQVMDQHLKKVRAWLTTRSNIHSMDLNYRKIIAEPTAEAERVNQFLHGVLDVRAMSKVVDPALYRQRQT